MDAFARRIVPLIRYHRLALAFALLVGVTAVAPHFLAVYSLQGQYQGVPFLFLDNEYTYLDRIREILDGHPLVGSPLLFEYKSSIAPVLPFGEYLYVLLYLLSGASLVTAVIVSKFLFPAILFLLAYVLVYLLASEQKSEGSRMTALAGGLAVIFGYDIMNLQATAKLLSGSADASYLLVWTRLVNPVTGAMFLLVFLILEYLIFARRTKYLFIPAGIVLGIMSSYFFSWGTALAVAGSLTVIAFGLRRTRNALLLLGSIAVSVFVQASFLFRLGLLTDSANLTTLGLRNGLLLMRQPVVNKVVLATTIIALAVFAYQLYSLRKQERTVPLWWWYLLALLSASWIVFNQQIITGRAIWYFHFVQYTIPLSVILIVVMVGTMLRPKFPKLLMAFVILTIVGTLSYGVLAAATYRIKQPEFARRQSYQPLFSELDRHPGPCVVFTVEDTDTIGQMIAAHTHCDLYWTTYSFFGIPPERIIHNFLLLLRLRGIAAADIDSYLHQHIGEVHAYFFRDWLQLFSDQTDQDTEATISRLVDAYQELAKKNLADELFKYKLDYIVTSGDLEARIDSTLSLKLLETYGDQNLYSIVKKN